jgi:thymidylate synthase (FAD)
VDDLPEAVKQEWEQRQLSNWKTSFEHYQWALNNEIAKECARFVLPLGCATKLYMQGTVRSWIHYLQLRCGHGTQKEHMDIANEIKKSFVVEFPHTSKALGWL